MYKKFRTSNGLADLGVGLIEVEEPEDDGGHKVWRDEVETFTEVDNSVCVSLLVLG